MKKFRNKFLLVALASLTFSCGENIDADGPLDEDVVLSGKSDSPLLREGSDEAKAVLQYVNRPLTTQNESDAFLTDLDSKLHSLVAGDIVAFRLGVDGIVGTQDDLEFKNIHDLVAIPFLGKASLKLLFDLANDAGFFSQTISCNDIRREFSGAVAKITTLDQLVEIQISKCTTFTNDVLLDIEQKLPPKHRSLNALDRVTTIDGTLEITDNIFLEAPEFRGLKRVGRIKTPVSRDFTFRFAPSFENLFNALEDADHIETKAGVLLFPSLKRVGILELDAMTVNVFPALLEAGTIVVNPSSEGRANVETGIFPLLKKVHTLVLSEYLEITGLRNLEEMNTLESSTGFKADFTSLTKLDSIKVQRFSGSFPKLESIRTLDISVTSFPFPVLKVVEEDFIMRGGSVSQMPSQLERVGGKFDVSHPTSAFNKLTEVGGNVLVWCSNSGMWEGLNALSSFRQLAVTARGCSIGGFKSIVKTESPIEIEVDEEGSFNGLQNLMLASWLDYSDRSKNPALFPNLKVAISLRLVAEKSGEIVGFENLTLVEEDLKMQSAATIVGLNRLEAVGEEIVFPKQMSKAEQDKFLSRLPSFSGRVKINTLD